MDPRIRKNSKKVLVVGLDGATFDLIMPWITEGLLPNMFKMLRNGLHNELISTIPMFTPTAWSSFMTGKNPGKHGVTGFFTRDKKNYELSLINPSNIRGNVLWDILGENGKRVIIINVPTTYPPKKVNGLLITGMLTPSKSKNFTYPLSLRSEINALVGEYKIYPSHLYSENREDLFISDVFKVTEIQAKTAEYLMQKYPWDFFMIVFTGGDQLQHAFWKHIDAKHPKYCKEKEKKYREILFQYYKKTDDVIGRLFDKSGKNATKIVMSDHGFGPLYKFIHINQWLIEKKLLKFKNNPFIILKYQLFKLGITPESVYNIFLKVFLGDIRSKLGRRKGHKLISKLFLSFSDVDWKKSRAFSMGAMGQIYLNVKGRESKGIVQPGEEYRILRKKISNLLYKLNDADTGKPVIDQVFFKEDIYHGCYLKEMPDIVILPGEGYIGFEEYEFASNKVLKKSVGISGTHRLNGILIASGPNIKGGFKLKKKPKIWDITPTIYKVMNIPVPSEVDGSVLKELITKIR